jgi:hypothetical protein
MEPNPVLSLNLKPVVLEKAQQSKHIFISRTNRTMSLALNSAQQNLAKVIDGKAEKEALKEQKKQDEEDGHQTTENNTPAPEEDEKQEREDDGEEYEYTGVIFEGVEYLVNEETGEILDPDNFVEMGSWNADTQSIDWVNEDAKKQHLFFRFYAVCSED